MTRKGRITAVLLTLALSRPALAAMAARPPADPLSEARLIEAALNGLTGLVADFTQTVESAALPKPQVETGTMFLLRPGRMRFEYEQPPGKVAIADSRKTWLYLPEEHRVLVAPIDAQGAGGMSLLLQEKVDIAATFVVTWAGEGGSEAPAPRLKLTPRSADAGYQYLMVESDAEHLIRALAVVDPLGSTVTYRFSRLRRTSQFPEAMFRFTAPRGVEVQELRP
ncbi:MAG TPA: outer membrane lipoprotein carrier protein LolA [Candidatus Polarisedimenticolia bacterium]|nr:outer membrane lipoprotein carrier protein LolA [Candidatus Polarisedimenticolia bacterium]